MQNDKISTYLGFCIRSGKIVFGVDRAEALKKGVHLLIAPVVIEAMKKGAEDLAHKDTFKGYPDYEGYAFLREAISNYMQVLA